MRKAVAWMLAAMLCLLPLAARADVRLYRFAIDQPPPELTQSAFAIPAAHAELTLTFAGDCTLGGEPELATHPDGFVQTVAREGYAYPFSGLQDWFATDDVTLVNLEGVLSDSRTGRRDKEFTFIGQPAYTEILTLGSVECVTLANNHTMDFGRRGFRDTCQALDDAGIGYVTQQQVLVMEKDGYRIGITASAFTLDRAAERQLATQMEGLRALGCLAIIHVMHAGVEYQPVHSPQQRKVAQTAADLGADLVVGHHPHVPQDTDMIGDCPVIYSLGNCCFGGNLNPDHREGQLLRVVFRFSEDRLVGLDWHLVPILISGGESGNDYRPTQKIGGS